MNVGVGQVAVCLVALNCAGRGSDAAAANTPSDATSEVVEVAAHPAALPLIEEFVARDAQGEFTRANAWFNGAVDCPGHEPGPDEAAVATAHSVRILSRGRDSAMAEVTWQRVGYMGSGGERPAPGVDIDTLRALRTRFGWRIVSPALDPHAPAPVASRPDV